MYDKSRELYSRIIFRNSIMSKKAAKKYMKGERDGGKKYNGSKVWNQR